MVNSDEKFLVSYSCCTIRTLLKYKNFLNFYLDSGEVLKQATHHTTSNSIPDLGIQKINEFIISLPPLNEQKAIVEKVNQLMAWCDELEKKIEKREIFHEKIMQAVVKQIGNIAA